MSNYDFNIGNTSIPTLTLNASDHLTFNRISVELLNKPPFITIGLDSESLKLMILPKNNDTDPNFRCYKFFTEERKSKSIAIYAKCLTEKIIRLLNKPIVKGGFVFKAEYSETDKALIVNLNDIIFN